MRPTEQLSFSAPVLKEGRQTGSLVDDLKKGFGWMAAGAISLVAVENSDASFTKKSEGSTLSGSLSQREMQPLHEKLMHVMSAIAKHSFATEQEAKDTAATLNLAQLLLNRRPQDQAVALRALTHVQSALGLMPKTVKGRFCIVWQNARWTVKAME